MRKNFRTKFARSFNGSACSLQHDGTFLKPEGCLSSQVEEIRDPLLRVSACDMDLHSLELKIDPPVYGNM